MENCVFCDRKMFENRLVGETENFWIIATLGQISDGGYLLLVPKRHVPCIGAMDKSEISKMESLSKKIGAILEKKYGTSHGVIFEHGIVGQTVQHAHLHFIPKSIDLTEKIRRDFPKNEIIPVESLAKLQEAYTKRQEPYLFWRNLEGMHVCWNPPAPLMYMRIIAAEILGRPERANWRSMDPVLDKKLWESTVTDLKVYFQS